MNEHFPNQDAYKKLSFFYVTHETLKHSIGPLIESGFVEYFVSHIKEWVHDFTEKITDIVECHEYCSALLLLIDLWAEINICTPQLYKELRAIVFEKLFLYGSNIGIAYYKELLQTELKITDEIMDKNEEWRFLSQAEKCSREYAKMEEFIKSTKDTLILHRAKKSIDDEDNTNFKEIYSTIDEFRSKNFKYFEVEAKAILYLESLYESKRVYLEEMKEKSQLLDQFKETLSKFRARDGEVVS